MRIYLDFLFQGPENVDHHDGDFFWADITAFTIFRDPDFCYEVMPKIFEYLKHNTELKERDIYITFNDILPHHVGRNGKIFSNKNIKKIIIIIIIKIKTIQHINFYLFTLYRSCNSSFEE